MRRTSTFYFVILGLFHILLIETMEKGQKGDSHKSAAYALPNRQQKLHITNNSQRLYLLKNVYCLFYFKNTCSIETELKNTPFGLLHALYTFVFKNADRMYASVGYG